MNMTTPWYEENRWYVRLMKIVIHFHPGAQTDLMNDRTPRFIAPGVLVAYVDRGIL